MLGRVKLVRVIESQRVVCSLELERLQRSSRWLELVNLSELENPRRPNREQRIGEEVSRLPIIEATVRVVEVVGAIVSEQDVLYFCASVAQSDKQYRIP